MKNTTRTWGKRICIYFHLLGVGGGGGGVVTPCSQVPSQVTTTTFLLFTSTINLCLNSIFIKLSLESVPAFSVISCKRKDTVALSSNKVLSSDPWNETTTTATQISRHRLFSSIRCRVTSAMRLSATVHYTKKDIYGVLNNSPRRRLRVRPSGLCPWVWQGTLQMHARLYVMYNY